LVGEADVVELDEGVLGVDMGVALTDARWTTDGGEGEVVVEDVVELDGLGTAEATGIGKVGEGVDTVPEDDVLVVDEDGATNRTGESELDMEVVELLPDEVTDGLEEVLDVDGGTETDVGEDVLLVRLEVLDVVGVMEEVLDVDGGTETDVDEDVLLVRLEVLDVVGVMELELELVDKLGLLDEVVGVDGTLEELDEEEALQPGVVKNEVTQSVFAALRKKTSLLKIISGQETVLVMQGPKLIEEDGVGLDVVVIIVRLEVLDVVGVMELKLLNKLELLDEVVGVAATLKELDEEETLQPGVVKKEVSQSVFAALRKKTSLLKIISGQETVLVMQGPELIEEDSVGLDAVVITILTGGLEEVEAIVGIELLLLVVLIKVEGDGEEK
jgi:hypothetical protein